METASEERASTCPPDSLLRMPSLKDHPAAAPEGGPNPVPRASSLTRSVSLMRIESPRVAQLTSQTDYEERGDFNLARALRVLGHRSGETKHGLYSPNDLMVQLGGERLLNRVRGMEPWVIKQSSGEGLAEILAGPVMFDPVTEAFEGAAEGDTPLTPEEVREIRLELLNEIRICGAEISQEAADRCLRMKVSRAIVSGPEHATTRAQIRIASQPLPGRTTPDETIRSWFAHLKVTRTENFFSQVDGSPLLVGNGPAGGHGSGSLDLFKGLKIESNDAHFQENLNMKRGIARKPSRAYFLHGSDINGNDVYRQRRDDEVVSFLVDLLEMEVKAVIANGFVCAHDEVNVKSLLEYDTPYMGPAHVWSGQALMGPRSTMQTHPSYKKGACRDFFNYFGAANGDDGINWKLVGKEQQGLPTRQAHVAGVTLTSTLLAEDREHAPWEGTYKAAAYKLKIQWREGLLWFSKQQHAEIRVLHLQVMDQGPAQLTRKQASLLYNTVAGNAMDSIDLGFRERANVFVHCHAGLGRTGNIALGLAELLCEDVPSDPKEKLQWIRGFRPGLVQSAEQLIDGLQLSVCVLHEVYERVKHSPLERLKKAKEEERMKMEENRRHDSP